MKKKGFSLIEALVVIALCGVIALLGMVQFSFLDSTMTHAEIDKFLAACIYLQQKAIATNKDYVLRFDSENNAYYVDDIYEKLSSHCMFDFLPRALGPPGSPSSLITKAVTFPGNCIYFYPTGIISSGTVYLVDKKKRCMYALSNAVSQVSFLRLYRYDGKWKLLEPQK